MGSLSRDTQLYIGLHLLFGEGGEESNFLFAGRFPLIVRFESGLQVSFDVYIEGLGLYSGIGRVVHTRYSTSRSQVMQVTSELAEFSSSVLLLPLVLIVHSSPKVVVQLFADFFVLSLYVHQVVLSGIEIVLVLARIIATVTDTNKVQIQNS